MRRPTSVVLSAQAANVLPHGRLGQGLEFVADLLGVGVPQILEDGLGLFPGVAGGVEVAGGVVRVAEASEGGGCAVALPGPAEQDECLEVALDGLPVVAEVVVGVAQAVTDRALKVLDVEAAAPFRPGP